MQPMTRTPVNLGARGTPEEALFGASEDDLFSFDEDSLFGGDLLIEVDDPGGQALEEVFLVRDRIDAGGTYRAAYRLEQDDGRGRPKSCGPAFR